MLIRARTQNSFLSLEYLPSFEDIRKDHRVHVSDMRGWLTESASLICIFRTLIVLTGIDIEYGCCDIVWFTVLGPVLCSKVPPRGRSDFA